MRLSFICFSLLVGIAIPLIVACRRDMPMGGGGGDGRHAAGQLICSIHKYIYIHTYGQHKVYGDCSILFLIKYI